MRTPSKRPTKPGNGDSDGSGCGCWIHIPTSMMQSDWYQDSRMVHLFLHLLLIAEKEDTDVGGMAIKRGQVFANKKALGEAVGIPWPSPCRVLQRLAAYKLIEIQDVNTYVNTYMNTKTTLITIYDYDSYVSSKNKGEHLREHLHEHLNADFAEKQPETSYTKDIKIENRKCKEYQGTICLPTCNSLDNNPSIHPSPRVRDFSKNFTETEEARRKANVVVVKNEEFRKAVASDRHFLKYAARTLRSDDESINTLLELFAREVNEKVKAHRDSSDYRQHFFDWVRIHISMNNKKENRHERQRQDPHVAAINRERAKYGLPPLE